MNEAQIALNEVILNCQAAAGRYRDASEITEDSKWATWFRSAAARRDKAVTELQDELRRQGELPHDLEQEAETFRSLATHMRAAVAQDQQGQLFELCRQSEEKISEAVAAAPRNALPEPAAELLARLADDIRETLAGLRSPQPG